MKKILLIMLVALAIVSCQKEKVDTLPATQDVSFKALEVTPDGGLKSTDIWECKDAVPTHAWINISFQGVETNYYPELFTLDGVLYTQAIKLPIGNYCVEDFVLYKEVNGVEGIGITDDNDATNDDIVVFGTPYLYSAYAVYVTYPLQYCFNVLEFQKTQVPIQVLCFQDADYDKFGFNWFQITEIVIREQCFFGDICIADPAPYANSIYAQGGGVQVDEEAAIRVIVKKDGVAVPYSPFDNLSIYGTGAPLCVAYPDNLSVAPETFTFELQVWVPSAIPGVFVWQTYATFTTTDALPIPEAGADGVVDFAVGDCSPDSYPIFQWLAPLSPSDSFGFRIKGAGGDDIYLGVGDVGVQTNRVQADAGNPLANGTYPVTFTFDNTTNVITLAFAGKNLSMDMDNYPLPCTAWNGFTVMVRDSKDNGAIEWQNILFNGNPFVVPATYDVPGTPGFITSFFAGDFSQSFTVTADLVVYGLNANESLKAEMHVVCL